METHLVIHVGIQMSPLLERSDESFEAVEGHTSSGDAQRT
jgi:hypothetical protein